MHGFIHSCLQDLILKKFGEETWQLIIKRAGVDLEGGRYIIHKTYSDEETTNLMKAVESVLGIELNDVLDLLGQHFYHYCVQSGYGRILKVLGRNLREFLSNLDALHDHLATTYAGMNAPSFRTTDRPDGGLDLKYYSSREGLGYIVIGIIKIFAKENLLTDIDIKIDKTKDQTGDHTVFSIHERKTNLCKISPSLLTNGHTTLLSKRVTEAKLDISNILRKKSFMNVQSFVTCFPFHVVFDRQMKLIQCGASIKEYLPLNFLNSQIDLLFVNAFKLERPKMQLTFDNVLAHINTVFVVTSQNVGSELDGINNVTSDKSQETTVTQSSSMFTCPAGIRLTKRINDVTKNPVGNIKLKGQMVYLSQKDCILFLCSPRVDTLDDMENRGLYFSDIPLHDVTRDFIIMKQSSKKKRQLVKEIEDSTNGLVILQSKLFHKKKITDELLHELLPKNVAAQLRLNKPVRAESYSLVSILFSDLVGFTALCSNENVFPMDIIKLLNELYTSFDAISNVHDVYKVETIGDAYMGVTGIPTPCIDHAEKLCNMACDILVACTAIKSPADRMPVQIRVGLHSGPVMAGVVGKKMPRYCLFGNTVSIGNKIESASNAGRINVSCETKRYLNKTNWHFDVNPVETIIPCFFVTRNEIHITPFPDCIMTSC